MVGDHARHPWVRKDFGDWVGRDLGIISGRPYGTCKWCKRPCKPLRSWHSDCVLAYNLSRGSTKWVDVRNLDLPYECAICGCETSLEVDHTLSLAVARHLGRRHLLRSFWFKNLRYLCHDCHACKTAADRRALKRLLNPKEHEVVNATEQPGWGQQLLFR